MHSRCSSMFRVITTGTISKKKNYNTEHLTCILNIITLSQRNRSENSLGLYLEHVSPSRLRSNTKGEISNQNLRKRRQREWLRKSKKQPLHIPSSKTREPTSSLKEKEPISLIVVKKELEALIKRNRIYTNRREERESLLKSESHQLTEERKLSSCTSDENKLKSENVKNNVRNHEVESECNNYNIIRSRNDNNSSLLRAQNIIINNVNKLEDEDTESNYSESEKECELSNQSNSSNKLRHCTHSVNQNTTTLINSNDNYSRNDGNLHLFCNNLDKPLSLLSETITSENVRDNSDVRCQWSDDEDSNTNNKRCVSEVVSTDERNINHCSSTANDNNNNNNNSSSDLVITNSSATVNTAQYEWDLEHHFAIQPNCTIFGTDLDRLEYDMMREFHQIGERLPNVDSAYSTFGATRKSRRLQWQPSSSFDKISPSTHHGLNTMHEGTEVSEEEEEKPVKEINKYHMSSIHMFAEAYAREKQQQRAREGVGKWNSNGTSHCFGINYCKVNPQERDVTNLHEDRSNNISSTSNTTETEVVLPNSSNDWDLPAYSNPHFPCEVNDNVEECEWKECKEREHVNAMEQQESLLPCTSSFSLSSSSSSSSLSSSFTVNSSKDNINSTANDIKSSNNTTIRNSNSLHSNSHEDLSWVYLYNDKSSREREIVIDGRTAFKDKLVIHDAEQEHHNNAFDAFYQRPSETAIINSHGYDYWHDNQNWHSFMANVDYREKLIEQERLREGAVDTCLSDSNIQLLRKKMMLFAQRFPVNEMIQEPFVRIRSLRPRDGNIPTHEARQMAKRLGLDLIHFGVWYINNNTRNNNNSNSSSSSSNSYGGALQAVALCTMADYREYMREDLSFTMKKIGVNVSPTPECIEVGFRGGTLPHAIRVKAIGIAKHLLQRHVIRINLTEFGTPREGFPVLQVILDEVKRQTLRLHAFHTAGVIQANYNEIYTYLYPPTGRSPKLTVSHPTPQEVCEARDFYTLMNDKQVYFDGVNETRSGREYLEYLHKIENGTAWAHMDNGLSLQRQRRLKVMLGYLPKGNKDIYAARGDVNIPQPFHTAHSTTIHNWLYPRESNLEQACRGAAVLGKRAGMHVSDMHDANETSDNSTVLNRSYYRVEGPALEVGELKEALGLKDNRKRPIPLAPGFATLGLSTRENVKHETPTRAKENNSNTNKNTKVN